MICRGVPVSVGGEQADAVAASLTRQRVETDAFRYRYVPYGRPLFRKFFRECRTTERWVETLLALPCHEAINAGNVTRLASSLELASTE